MRSIHIILYIFLLPLTVHGQHTLAHTLDDLRGWNLYPDYPTYLTFMDSMATSHPDICTLLDIGRSAEGRRILAIRITAPGDTSMRVPVLLSSTIHGDETTGYMLSLRLIDSLLSVANVPRLLQGAVLYVAPLLNPDGTYGNCDTTIHYPTRYNSHGIDLNRDFPPVNVPPQDIEREPETQAIMDFAISRRFSFSVSLHGGDEVVNYPWDSFDMAEAPLPDLEWWQAISGEYVDSLRAIDPYTLRTVCPDGQVFGSDWYKVTGGMQDWMYCNVRCRETTIEISSIKTASPQLAHKYWNLCSRALINFLGKACVGFSGTVSDMMGNPIPDATIIISGHDEYCSSVVANSNGIYFRPTLPDIAMEACAVADGFVSDCRSVVSGIDDMTTLDFVLEAAGGLHTASSDLLATNENIHIYSRGQCVEIESPQQIVQVDIASLQGQGLICHHPYSCSARYNLRPGIYVIRVKSNHYIKTQKIAILK